MKRIIVKMKANRAITIAAVVLFVVTPSPFAVLRAADEQPPRYDADNPKPGAPIDAEKLRRLAWGPPATNGLRAAGYFEPTKDAYVDGEVVKRRVVFHNGGEKPVLFTVGLGGNDDGWTVVDDQGRKVPVQHVTYSGLVALGAFRLQPGHAVEFDCMSTGMGASTKAEDPADTAIQAKPGMTCRVRWTLQVLETTRTKDGKGVPVAGVWHGTLTTGEVRFRIVGKGGGPGRGRQVMPPAFSGAFSRLNFKQLYARQTVASRIQFYL
jgi:hypothetical protein